MKTKKIKILKVWIPDYIWRCHVESSAHSMYYSKPNDCCEQVVILPTHDYQAMKKELRDLRKELKVDMERVLGQKEVYDIYTVDLEKKTITKKEGS